MGENIRDKQLQFTETLVDEWCLSACLLMFRAAKWLRIFLSSLLIFHEWKNHGHGFISRCYRYYCHIINRTRNLSQSLLGIVSLLAEFGHGLPFPRWNPPSSIVPQSERLSINILEDDRWCGELWRARNKVAARKTEDGFGLPLWLRVIEERKRKINVSEIDGTCIFWIFERRRGWSYIL